MLDDGFVELVRELDLSGLRTENETVGGGGQETTAFKWGNGEELFRDRI